VEKIVGADTVLANGGEVKSLVFVPGRSTTNLIKKARKSK
jgi:D-beta-D-heptose 7-phosphate kinase/D-beta-D-heptose 1-phosphate adenosyltransferase